MKKATYIYYILGLIITAVCAFMLGDSYSRSEELYEYYGTVEVLLDSMHDDNPEWFDSIMKTEDYYKYEESRYDLEEVYFKKK